MDVQLLVGIGQILAVALIPIITWFMGVGYQNRHAKRSAKQELFFTLMANRKAAIINKDWVDALNQIDVIFQDDKKVRRAWREYLDSLNENSPHFVNNNSYLLDLLSEMAISLGYKNLKQTEIDRVYSPKAFGDISTQQQKLLQETIRVLSNSESFGISFGEVKNAEKQLTEVQNGRS